MWIGLFINLAYSMVPVDVGELATDLDMTLESTEIEEQIKQMTNMLRFGSLLFQFIGILAFFVNPRVGLTIALCASIPTFINSCVYIFGALFTYYRFRFGAFSERPDQAETVAASFASWKSSMLLRNSMVLFCGSLLVVFFVPSLLMLLIAMTCMFVALIMLVLGVRLRILPALTFYSSGLAILPHIMARTVFLPYETIRSATLLAGSVVQFQVEMESGIYALDLPLQNIHPDERKAAVAKIADTMQAKGIQVY